MVTLDFHFDFVEDDLQIFQFHIDRSEVGLGLIDTHFHIKDLV